MGANDNPGTPLSPSAQDALDRLTPIIEDSDESLSRKEALSHLRQFDFDAEHAHTTLDELLDKGYLYEVGETLRLP
ncbi:hypothetical protein [Haladaptatus sp. NG-SE-30]